MIKSQLEKHRVANKKAVEKHRTNKKDKTTTCTPIKAFKTPQPLGKDKNRVKKHLPQSPRHKKELILSMAEECGIKVTNSTNGNKSISKDIIKKVKEYFLENSCTCLGKKVVIVREKNKPKEKWQKHFMLTTLKEAYASYKIENPVDKLSLSKFCDLWPPEVKLIQEIPHSSCLCIYHENVRLLLIALNRNDSKFPMEFRGFIDKVVCNQENESCMLGKYTSCPYCHP